MTRDKTEAERSNDGKDEKQIEKVDLEAKQSREDGVKEEVKAKDKHDEKYDLGNKVELGMVKSK